jgi:hypothetical protein
MNIRFSQEVKLFIQDWAFILFQKEYFSFYETANEYVSNIVDSIYDNIPHEFLWRSPQQDYFKLIYGKDVKYIKYNVPGSRTVWYVFFEYSEEEDAVLVLHITNGQRDAHRIN